MQMAHVCMQNFAAIHRAVSEDIANRHLSQLRACLVGVWYVNNSHVNWYTECYRNLTPVGKFRAVATGAAAVYEIVGYLPDMPC